MYHGRYLFFASLQVVLSTFEAQPLSDEEGDAINMEEEAANFGIKYLTSSKLMGLEVSALETCTKMQKFGLLNFTPMLSFMVTVERS